jgi:predicted permease
MMLDDFIRDVRLALRAIARAPGFALVAIITIGLGAGATTSLFSVINALLLQPLPVSSPERLFSIQEQRTGSISTGVEGVLLPYERYRGYEEATRDVFDALAAQQMRQVTLRDGGPARPALAVATTGNFFAVLGIAPAAGSFYRDDDEPAVVLGYRYWLRRHGGDPRVIGGTVRVNGAPMTVAGVAARGFGGTTVGVHVDLWIPERSLARAGSPAWLTPFGRLRPGVEPAVAAQVVAAAALRIPLDEEGTEVQGARLAALRPVPAEARGVAIGFLGLLFGTALLVLLIASANLAGMLLARSAARQREMAVRLAIGAGRARLVRQLLTESLVIFVLGGAAGVVIAMWATRLLARLRVPQLEQLVIDAAPDVRVLAFALTSAALTGLLFGLLPALQATRPTLATPLRDGAGGASRRLRGRGVFVAAQFAMCVLLLAVAGLLVRTLQRAATIDAGFRTTGIVVAGVSLAPAWYDEAGAQRFQAELIERVQALPDVAAAALARHVLLGGSSLVYTVRATADSPPVAAGHNIVDANWFDVMAVPLVAGRGITAMDHPGAARVAVVNETLARRLWPDGGALGRQYVRGGETYEVIGVARDGRYVSLGEEPQPFAFVAAAQHPARDMMLHVRVRPGAHEAAVSAALGDVLAALDPDVALERAQPLAAALNTMLLPQRVAAALIGVFGLLGLVLAGIGAYGVLAFHVAQRTREIGIRMAVGATARHVVALVLRRSAWLAAGGVGTGLLLAAALTRFLSGLLHGVSPLDPLTFAGVALLLCAVALFAAWLPARRATRIEVVEALREG